MKLEQREQDLLVELQVEAVIRVWNVFLLLCFSFYPSRFPFIPPPSLPPSIQGLMSFHHVSGLCQALGIYTSPFLSPGAHIQSDGETDKETDDTHTRVDNGFFAFKAGGLGRLW